MADKLILRKIHAECRIGVTPDERALPQRLSIDVELAIDAGRAAEVDRMKAAVDYVALVEQVRVLCAEQSYHLVETVAEALAKKILEAGSTTHVRVVVRKRAVAGLGYAAVEVERRRTGRAAAVARSRR